MLKVKAQIQQDGSYLAFTIEVKEHYDGEGDGGNGKSGDGTDADHHRK